MINIVDKENCCGCNACVQKCPTKSIFLYEDNEGFLYPQINTGTCTQCGLCDNLCPSIKSFEYRKNLSFVFAAQNKIFNDRYNSSSGGIFKLLCELVIKNGGVVFGARFDENWNVTHDFASTYENLTPFYTSKYVQSKINNSYKDAKKFLKQDKTVLFSGTPCQIAGLQSYLGKEYNNLLLVDVVCHGVPSPKVWQIYLDILLCKLSENDIKIDKKNLTKINFRDKVGGWKNFSFSTCYISGESNFFAENLHSNPFMKGFLADLYLRPSCYSCPSKSFNSGSDITLGDFWGINKSCPEFDDDKGTSLVIINSNNGLEYFNKLDLKTMELSYDIALSGNSALEHSVRKPKKRDAFFQQLDTTNFISLIDSLTYKPVYQKITEKGARYLKRKLGF